MKSAITKKHVSLFKKFTVASLVMIAAMGCALDEQYTFETSGSTSTLADNLPECNWSGGGDFDSGVPNSGNPIIPGWTFVADQIRIGLDKIAGLPTPEDPTQLPLTGLADPDSQYYNPSDNRTAPPNYDRNSADIFSTSQSNLSSLTKDGSIYSIEISSAGSDSAADCDIVHGPYIFSNNDMILNRGDSVEFDWFASDAGDWYDVFGYVIDVNDNYTEIILDSTGEKQDWTTATHTLSRNGEYKFVFVAGSFDYTCGQAIGGKLNIDNIRVKSSNSNSCQ